MSLRKLKDRIAGKAMILMAAGIVLLLAVIAGTLFFRSVPLLIEVPFQNLFLSTTWMPQDGQFGYLVPLAGTLAVTGIALLISIPLSLLSAIYLAEYAGERVRANVLPLIDLLAGIPSVIFGVWGLLVVVPAIKVLESSVGPLGIPLLGSPEYDTGFSVLAGGIVLAIMVFPIVISITEQVLRAVPFDTKEAALGIAAAIILGFSRAFGETIAVLMVVGNVAQVPGSVFDPALPLPALIANNYGEMMSIPLYDSALLFAALILMIVVLIFTVLARLVLIRVERGMTHG